MKSNFVRAQALAADSNGNGRSHGGKVVSTTPSVDDRVWVDGKFFRVGAEKFWVKGVTYGPFRPNSDGVQLPERDQIVRDFEQLRELGANTIRVYRVPPRWLLDDARSFGLKVLVDVPWSKHLAFLDNKESRESGRRAVREAATTCKDHPALLAYSVANEIPPDVARWLGANRVERYVAELVDIAKQIDPDGLTTFASFPPTEYLHPRTVDFYTMNVYLHSREKFRAYLGRLQNQSDEKPLLLGEYGIDSMRHGEVEQAELVSMHLEEVFRCGLAGTCVFSYTDDWFTGGHQIDDWAFGLVTRDRQPKQAFHRVAETFRGTGAPVPPLERYPRVSVVVCSYNGASTLDGCLRSLERLNYPDYEVILVDDGSTDDTLEIAQRHPNIRYHFQRNKGLSVARNVGMELATGEIVAYTDSDCFADEDWLYFLVSKLFQTGASAVGGPNLLPANDGPVAACVAASPGSPAHILIDDEVAEHVPGCNMAFWTDRLKSIDGFDPVYTKAGDDVDMCWRLQEQGEKIVYSPSAMVWHHRRSTVKAYLKQQRGYGEAEALLKRKHPDKFRGFRSDASWVGRIYTRAGLGLSVGKPVVHFGKFASGMFQTIYAPLRLWWPLMVLSLEWWLAMCVMISQALVFHPVIYVLKKRPVDSWEATLDANLLAQILNPLLHVPFIMLLTTCGVSYWVAGQARPAEHQRRWWSRLLIAAMHIAQPVERAFARYRARFQTIQISTKMHAVRRLWEGRAARLLGRSQVELWSEDGTSREQLLERMLAFAKKNKWNVQPDSGWTNHDLLFHGDRWCKLRLLTVTENHGGGKLLTRVRLRLRATLFYSGLMIFLLYVLILGWMADYSSPEPGGDYIITRPWTILHNWYSNHRWELVLIPICAAIMWRMWEVRRQLNRTVMASVLSAAEQVGMTVVGAPDLLRKPAPAPQRAEPERPDVTEPVVTIVDQGVPAPVVAAPGAFSVPSIAPAPGAPAPPPASPVAAAPSVHAPV